MPSTPYWFWATGPHEELGCGHRHRSGRSAFACLRRQWVGRTDPDPRDVLGVNIYRVDDADRPPQVLNPFEPLIWVPNWFGRDA